ncbi:MAG: alpha/beta hydrolase [Treponema sp.]|nr:alpha/beta hydrolase [Treponema sp.]MCL2272224.1 alpha/beta hydrolase [Treponema sp.]
MAKKKIISFKVKEPVYFLDEEVTYAQEDAWYGHVTRDLRMDIIYPQAEDKQFPCIVWICGGYWMQMNKGAHIPYLSDLARRGFVVASADYRLGHEAPFPGALLDIKAAIRYLRAHAKRYSINTNKFGVMGESAGGYLVAMTALACKSEFEAGNYLDYSSGVQAACCWYPPCDIAGMAKENSLQIPFFAGDLDDKRYCDSINPVTYVSADAPPFLLLHGTDDMTVPFKQSEMLYDALAARNIDVQFYGIKGEGHAGAQFFQKPFWDLIADFFREKLK